MESKVRGIGVVYYGVNKGVLKIAGWSLRIVMDGRRS
jgi:hypothetical protein